MHDETDTIKNLHETFLSLGGFGPPWSMHIIFWWDSWRMRGHKRDDLVMVMRLLRKEVARGWHRSCMSFTNVVKDLDKFDERLAMAKAIRRVDAPIAASRILSNAPVDTVVSAQTQAEWERMKEGLK